MVTLEIATFVMAAFLGYFIGRLSHYYLNFWIGTPNRLPHHWIYGLLLMIVGLLFFKNNLELWIFFFGLGLFISDLNDFLHFKIIAPTEITKKDRKFWDID